MKHLLLIFAVGFCHTLLAQATFTSAQSGSWTHASSWTLTSGTSTTNYPVAGDDVTISSGHLIEINTTNIVRCSNLTLSGAGKLLLDSLQNNLVISGNLTMLSSSELQITGGSVTALGLIHSVTAPGLGTGTTLISVSNAFFSIAGTMTLTGVNASRTAEIRIGNLGFITCAGALTTTNANAKINFTGNGALTMAGALTVLNSSSFTAGTGSVIYFGIPGTNQTITPLTYNRLVISGIGSGVKSISGSVTVLDTLTLLSDTLKIQPSGTLNINDGGKIVRTAGRLIGSPTLSGVLDLIYNNVTADTTADEMPTASSHKLRNLVINNVLGVTLGSDVTVTDKLTLQNGSLRTRSYKLTLSNTSGGSPDDPAVSRINGFVEGVVHRAIGTSTGVRVFPMGDGSLAYRELK